MKKKLGEEKSIHALTKTEDREVKNGGRKIRYALIKARTERERKKTGEGKSEILTCPTFCCPVIIFFFLFSLSHFHSLTLSLTLKFCQ